MTEMNKRKLWCNTHECDVRCNNVTSKTWQYSKKKMKYMWVNRSVKKYVCMSKCGRQVELMSTEGIDGKDTTPDTSVMGLSEGVNIDDYSGAIQGGSERITSTGL